MSVSDEIGKLHDLLTKGAITQAEFEQMKARLLERATARAAVNRFRLSNKERWIGGVCGGIAEITEVDPWIWRLVFALGLVFGGFSALLYILLWILVPREVD
jgi:phage shock protein PspC (stress-responsive transcriptional regulator)